MSKTRLDSKLNTQNSQREGLRPEESSIKPCVAFAGLYPIQTTETYSIRFAGQDSGSLSKTKAFEDTEITALAKQQRGEFRGCFVFPYAAGFANTAKPARN